MALTMRHWILAAALGCAAIATAYLPPRARPEDAFPFYAPQRESPEQRRAQQLASLVQRTRTALLLVEWRDSLLRWVPRQARAPGAALVPLIDGPIRPEIRRTIEEAFAAAWRSLGTTSPEIVVGVAVRSDRRRPGERPSRREYPLYLLPPATDGRTCLAVVPWSFFTSRGPQTAGTSGWALSGLGPCVFYAAFGHPGPAIERWLLRRDFDLAYDGSWPLPAKSAGRAGWARTSARERFWFWNNLYQYPFTSVACAGGRAEACRAAVVDTAGRSRGRSLPHAMIERRIWWGDRTRGPYWDRDFYLSDLVRQMGRDRFARFWRSPLSVDSAFFAAMGTQVGEWTRRWQADLLIELPIGTAARPAAAGLGLLFAALVLAGGAYLTTRRQVG